jgi:hypothetical protein
VVSLLEFHHGDVLAETRYPLIVEAALRDRSTSFVIDGEALMPEWEKFTGGRRRNWPPRRSTKLSMPRHRLKNEPIGGADLLRACSSFAMIASTCRR